MLTAALTNILGHDNRGDRPIEALLMVAWGRTRSAGSSKFACYAMEKQSSLSKGLGGRTPCGYYEDVTAWRDASQSSQGPV